MNQNNNAAPPNIADEGGRPFLDVHDTQVDNPLLRAGRCYKRAKMAQEMHTNNPQQVTTPELGQQIAYATQAAIRVPLAGGPAIPADAPAWFQAFQIQINARFDQMNQRFDDVDQRFDDVEARQVNQMAQDANDAIRPLRPPGQAPFPPPHFPATIADLRLLGNGNGIRNLLVYYGLPANPMPTRVARLAKHLGIKDLRM